MNTTDRLAAQRYAAAYDALSETTSQASLLAEDLRVAVSSLAEVKDYMANPLVSVAEKKKTVLSALEKAPKTAAFVALLVEAKRYHLLPEISARVDLLLDKRQHLLHAQVVSARPLSETQKIKTQQALSSRYGQTVKAVFQTDHELLGGLTVACNGEFLDGSIRGRLQKLQEELIK